MEYHIAQVNVARMLAPPDHASMTEFFDNLDAINALAEQHPGFVWRLKSENGNATSFRVNGDDRVLVNLSVWSSIEALEAYTYHSDHARFLKRRKEWFERPTKPHVALWWITKGRVPTLDEAMDRLKWLQKHGPGSHVFTFGKIYAAPLAA